MTNVADRLFAAIEAGDVDAVRDLYAPGALHPARRRAGGGGRVPGRDL